jgi:hypothetical protein
MPDYQIHVYDYPGGKQLSGDLFPFAQNVGWSTKAPGGDASLSFSLKRNASRKFDWPDLRPLAYVRVTGRVGNPIWGGRIVVPEYDDSGNISLKAEGLYYTAATDEEFDSTSTTDETPANAIEQVVRYSCPWIILPGDFFSHDHASFYFRFAYRHYRHIKPKIFFRHVSKLGSASGRVHDVMVKDQVLTYKVRNSTVAYWSLPSKHGVLKRAADVEKLYNKVAVQYRQTNGKLIETTFGENTQSQNKYGVVRTRTLRENELTDAQATSLRDTYLNFYSDLYDQYNIQTGEIFGLHNEKMPLGLVRAGDVIYVEGIGNLFIAETSFNADSNTLQIIPEHGWTDPDFIKKVSETTNFVEENTYYSTGGVALTPQDRDTARYDHVDDHYGLGGGPALDATQLDNVGNTSGYVPISDGNVNSNLNADKLDGYDAEDFSAVGHTHTNINADQLDGYHAGNSSGQIPISNGTMNVNLNADQLDGYHGSSYYRSGADATFNTIGSTSTCDLEYVQIDQWLHVDGDVTFNGDLTMPYGQFDIQGYVDVGSLDVDYNLHVYGTKNSIIALADDRIVKFTAMEGEITRFVCQVPITAVQAAQTDLAVLQAVVPTLPADYLDCTEAPYMILTKGASVNADGTASGFYALIVAPAKSTLWVQQTPYGEPGELPVWQLWFDREVTKINARTDLTDEEKQQLIQAATERRDLWRERLLGPRQ